MNCNSCCRAKSQQKPFSGGAFPVQSHRCHSPRPLLLCVSPPPPPLAQLDPPPPLHGQHPQLPSLPAGGASCVCVLGRKRRRRGWVGFFGVLVFFFSRFGAQVFAGSPFRATPSCGIGGTLGVPSFFFAVPVVKGPVAAAGRRHLLLRIPEMHFGRSPAVGCLVIAPVQEGVKPFPRGAAAGVQDPAQHPRGSLLLVGTRWLPSIAGFPRLW